MNKKRNLKQNEMFFTLCKVKKHSLLSSSATTGLTALNTILVATSRVNSTSSSCYSLFNGQPTNSLQRTITTNNNETITDHCQHSQWPTPVNRPDWYKEQKLSTVLIYISIHTTDLLRPLCGWRLTVHEHTQRLMMLL